MFPKEEIRFAVVLNGGVSLAVWMGGAVREIDRVTRGEGTYGVLLELLNATARADVIAGTSAGGINGAALALGQANARADVGLLRDLWNEQGRMEALLQQPFRGSPASLLRGDDYFLPKLHEAMKRLSTPW
jgi:predicted acylesterase/phospholipase RssA